MADPTLVAVITARLDAFEREMKRAGQVAQRELNQIERDAARSGIAIGTALGGAINDAVRLVTAGVAKFAREINEAAAAERTLGVNAEFFDGLRTLIERTGGSAANLADVLENFALAMRAAEQDEKSFLAVLFKQNNELLTTNKNIRSLADNFVIVARLVSGIGDPVDRLAALKELGLPREFLGAIDRLAREGLPAATAQSRLLREEFQRIAADARAFDNAVASWFDSIKAALTRLQSGISKEAPGFLERVVKQVVGSPALQDLDRQIEQVKTRLQAPAFAGPWLKEFTEFSREAGANFASITADWEQHVQVRKEGDRQLLESLQKRRAAEKKAAAETADENARAARDVKPAAAAAAPGKPTVSPSEFLQKIVPQVEKAVEVQRREAATIALTAEHAARLKTELQLLDGARATGIKLTEEQVEEFIKLRVQGIDPTTAAIRAFGRDIPTVTEAMQRLGATAETWAAHREAIQRLQAEAKEFSNALSQGFGQLILEGKKFDEVLQTIMKRLASRAIDRLFEMLILGPSGTGGGGLLGALIPRRQHGGPVTAGRPYMVGEKGPELFVPNRTGRVVAGGGAGSISIVSNVDARGSQMGEAQFRAIMAENNRRQQRIILDAVPARMAYQRANGT